MPKSVAPLKRYKAPKKRGRKPRWKGKHNKLTTSVKGKPNQIYTQRTLDAGMIDFGEEYDTHEFLGIDVKYGTKAWSSGTSAHSFAVINFPNFKINMLPKISEYANLFGRYKITFVEIRLVPAYSFAQVLVQNDAPAGEAPGNSVSNYLITRLSTKYDTASNNNRFDSTYGEDNVEVLDQFVKKKTITVSSQNVKGFKSYTKKPRQLEVSIKDVDAGSTTTNNVAGKWNDFDTGADINYIMNDCIIVRNSDTGRGITANGLLRYRVIYKVGIMLSGFQ